MTECPECGANADLTPDGTYAHCATCNTIFEPNKAGSSEKGSGSGSGDKEEAAKAKDTEGQSTATTTKRKEWSSGIQAREWKGK